MGATYVTVKLIRLDRTNGAFESEFLVDTGATDCLVPASELQRMGVEPEGTRTYQLADGSVREYRFGFARIEFMGEKTVGDILFGPEDAEPILGVTVLESVGIAVDPRTQTLRRLPAVPLK